ncbi:MAG: hypothetical protein ACYSTS_17275 [Planctomycetota bacterium]|jgi:hypothetical protein
MLQAKTLEITGQPEEPFNQHLLEYDVLEENLIIKNGRIYIATRFRDSSADIGSRVYTRHYFNNFLLSGAVKLDEESGEIYYIGDEGRISIGKRKKVFGLFNRVKLKENIKIITSPYVARLVITYQPEQLLSSKESLMAKFSKRNEIIEALLSRTCTQCHTIDYILEKPNTWTNEDWLHVLHRMQAKGPALLSKEEVGIMSEYLTFQRNELKGYAIKKPDKLTNLKQTYLLKDTDTKLFEKNKCVKCHTIDRVIVMHRARPWSKEKWISIIKRMKEKDPEIITEIDIEELVEFLYELKKTQN